LLPKVGDWLELSDLPVEGTPLKTINTGSGPVIHPAYYDFSNGAATGLPELSRNGQAATANDRLDNILNPIPVPVPRGTMAVIQMKAFLGANTPGNLIDGSGALLGIPFSLSFENRETVWHYSENSEWLTSQNPMPLSNGVIRQVPVVNGQGVPSTRELPNPQRGSHRQDPNDPQRLISLIYL